MKKSPTPKQQAFIEQYLVDDNATQAAIRSGYSKSSAYQLGHKLLQKPHIRDVITAAKEERRLHNQVHEDFILSRLVENVERAMESQPILDRAGNETGTYTWNGHVANRALELLAKYTNTFKDAQPNQKFTVLVETGVPGPPNSSTKENLQ